MKVKVVFINKSGEVEICWVDYFYKKENEVLIKVDVVGICGLDIGVFCGMNLLVIYLRIIGYEVIGIVFQEGVGMLDNIKKGDCVIVDFYIYCGYCYFCFVGRINCCENLNVIGVYVDGVMQEVVIYFVYLIYKILDNVFFEMVLLVELLIIVLYVLYWVNVKVGEYVVIIGVGVIGFMVVLSVCYYKVMFILIDIVEERLCYV